MVSEMNSDDTEILDDHVAPSVADNQCEQLPEEPKAKQEKRNGQLVVQSFQLGPHPQAKMQIQLCGMPAEV